jgi:hypothetical protein
MKFVNCFFIFLGHFCPLGSGSGYGSRDPIESGSNPGSGYTTLLPSVPTWLCVQYGEDSLDVTKSQYLKASRLEDLAANMGSTHRPALVEASKAFTDNKGVRRARKEVNKWKSSRGDVLKYRSSPFLQFSNSDAALAIRLGFL